MKITSTLMVALGLGIIFIWFMFRGDSTYSNPLPGANQP